MRKLIEWFKVLREMVAEYQSKRGIDWKVTAYVEWTDGRVQQITMPHVRNYLWLPEVLAGPVDENDPPAEARFAFFDLMAASDYSALYIQRKERSK